MQSPITVLNIGMMNNNVQQETSVSTKMCRLRPLTFLPRGTSHPRVIPVLARLYGPAARCKPKVTIWR